MNDEKRNHPLDLLTGEEHLSQLYQEANKEVPPPGLDATILDAARQAVHRKPRRVYFLASQKWTVPLSLAAALLVTIGVVRSVRHEMELPASLPQTPTVARPSVASPVDDRTDLKQEEQTLSEANDAPPETGKAPVPLSKMAEADAKRFSLPSATMLPAPAERQTRRDVPQLHTQERSQAVPLSVSPPLPSASEVVKKDPRSAEEWIAEIKQLRQAGKRAEAEASLKAFQQRYPGYPIEKALALPNTSHDVPKGIQ